MAARGTAKAARYCTSTRGDDAQFQAVGASLQAEGTYLEDSATCGRYHNVAVAAHMLTHLVRRSSGAAHSVDWQLHLRGADHHKKGGGGWRRNFTRPAQSFDTLKENHEDEVYMAAFRSAATTPVEKQRDRRKAALPIASIRDDWPLDEGAGPLAGNFQRAHGCEGTNVGKWAHLIRRPGVHRAVLGHETTLRDQRLALPCQKVAGGAVVLSSRSATPLSDNRSDACIVEMLGRKTWCGSRSPTSDAQAQRPASRSDRAPSRASRASRASGEESGPSGPSGRAESRARRAS